MKTITDYLNRDIVMVWVNALLMDLGGSGELKEFSQNNEGKSCYLCLVQGRHDGL